MRAKHGIAALILATCTASGPAYGQQHAAKDSGATGYPERPIRVIAPFPAGGGVDIIARLIGQGLSDAWGQPVVVDNRSGAGGSIGTHLAAKAAPDGHTMVLGSVGSVTFVPALYSKLPYDPQKDFTPISLVAIQPFVMTAHPSLPAGSLKEFIALAKSRPNEIRYGSTVGGASHLGIELLQLMSGIALVHVPYKGLAPATTAQLSGEIHVQLVGVALVLPHIKSGRLKAFAVGGAKRARVVPELPTISEAGVPGYEFDVWYGMLFPAGPPRAILKKANEEIVRLLKSPAMEKRFETMGLEPLGSTPEEFAARIEREIPKWAKIVKAAGISVQ